MSELNDLDVTSLARPLVLESLTKERTPNDPGDHGRQEHQGRPEGVYDESLVLKFTVAVADAADHDVLVRVELASAETVKHVSVMWW